MAMMRVLRWSLGRSSCKDKNSEHPRDFQDMIVPCKGPVSPMITKNIGSDDPKSMQNSRRPCEGIDRRRTWQAWQEHQELLPEDIGGHDFKSMQNSRRPSQEMHRTLSEVAWQENYEDDRPNYRSHEKHMRHLGSFMRKVRVQPEGLLWQVLSLRKEMQAQKDTVNVIAH